MRILFLASLIATPAAAQEARELCPDRPGLGTPACTVAPGTVVGELGLADWTRETSAGAQIDSVVAGDALVRFGLTERLEGQIGWTALGHVRERDMASGTRTRRSDIGDVTVAVRRNLKNPDGSGFSVAVMARASLPVGGAPIGAGDWGAGALLPVSFELGGGLSVDLTPQIDAAVDADGKGRHLGFGTVAGLGFALGESLSAAAEVSLYRDRDPGGHSTQALAGLSLGWQCDDDTQLDLGANLGLNKTSPDSQLYLGIVRRF